MTDRIRSIFHQIVNLRPDRGYDGRPVVDATSLPEGHQPGKWTNNRGPRRQGVISRGISARAPRPGMMVDANPMR